MLTLFMSLKARIQTSHSNYDASPEGTSVQPFFQNPENETSIMQIHNKLTILSRNKNQQIGLQMDFD